MTTNVVVSNDSYFTAYPSNNKILILENTVYATWIGQ